MSGISAELIPESLRAIGEGLYTELCMRFMFLVDLSIMVNHDMNHLDLSKVHVGRDLHASGFCYQILAFRKGSSIESSNDHGNKLIVTVGCQNIDMESVNFNGTGKPLRRIETYEYYDTELIDHIVRDIENYFGCKSHE